MIHAMDLDTYMTVEQFAAQFRYHPGHVRRMINKGELKAVKIGRWRISPEAVDEFIGKRMSDATKN